ncbi:MAG: hypothetical protein HYS05_00345, partial [Acidobacteria bacterium]|nr:hypothetical protein [Acidobacteriota bacterium]
MTSSSSWLPALAGRHWVALFAWVLIVGLAPASHTDDRAQRTTSYNDLIALFNDWRAFQKPRLVNDVPDYRAASMAAQHRELAAYQRRLQAIDPSGWPIHQQADYHIVRAEMNGLDFDHRVLRPWANNPAFYVTFFPDESDQPAREGPFAYGAVELWSYRFPLSGDDAAKIEAGLRIIPALLDQARTNLAGNGRDLWTYGTASIRQQSASLAQFQAKLPETATGLKPSVERARAATEAFAAWLD